MGIVRVLVVCACLGWVLGTPQVGEPQVKAFPSAEGFGANAVGGRGGTVIKVTNLNDSGAGSLRACMEGTGARTCIFTVSGTITLTNDIIVQAANSFLTVAGQTSPGGIQVKGEKWGLVMMNGAHDVIFRHMRVRPGGPAGSIDVGNAFLGYVDSHDIIIDHCSVQWGTDSMIMDYSSTVATNFTLQWCIIGEPALDGVGSRGKTMHIGSNGNNPSPGQKTSIHHNLFVTGDERLPFVEGAITVDFRNNLVYNWSNMHGPQLGSQVVNSTAKVNLVNNYFKLGVNSASWTNGQPITYFIWVENGNGQNGGTKVYISGNWGPGCPSGCADDWNNGVTDSDNSTWVIASKAKYDAVTPFSIPTMTTTPTNQVFGLLTGSTIGAYKPSRDAVDTKLIADAVNGTGDINSVTTGGPWPTLSGGAAPTDTDGDGIPDAWENSHALNPNNAADGPTIAANGYTNLENYLNELAGDIVFPSTPNAPTNLRLAP